MQLGLQHSGLEEKKQRNTNKIGRIAGTKQGRVIIMTIIFYAFNSALRHLLCRVVFFACDESTKRGRTSRGTSVKHASISVLS